MLLFMYVCMYVFMYLCMYVCINEYMNNICAEHIHIHMHIQHGRYGEGCWKSVLENYTFSSRTSVDLKVRVVTVELCVFF